MMAVLAEIVGRYHTDPLQSWRLTDSGDILHGDTVVASDVPLSVAALWDYVWEYKCTLKHDILFNFKSIIIHDPRSLTDRVEFSSHRDLSNGAIGHWRAYTLDGRCVDQGSYDVTYDRLNSRSPWRIMGNGYRINVSEPPRMGAEGTAFWLPWPPADLRTMSQEERAAYIAEQFRTCRARRQWPR